MAMQSPVQPILGVVESELEEYRRTGRLIHLAHAARALEEAKTALMTSPGERDKLSPTVPRPIGHLLS